MQNRKFIIIGETWLNIFFKESRPTDSSIGGCLVEVAESLARRGENTILLTEIGNDTIGKKINAMLSSAGINTGYADLYAQKSTIVIHHQDGAPSRYDMPGSEEGFDITWPRIEKEDVVVFGGYLALDSRVRNRLHAFLSNCKERKATIIYIPDVSDPRLQRITRVMPTIFENLEMADLVITLPRDLATLYGHDDADHAFKNNLSFYTPRAVCLSTDADSRVRAKSFGDISPLDEAGAASLPGAVATILTSLPS